MISWKIFTDLETCQKLWNQFSPKQSLWDLWEFNYCFFDSKFNELYFAVAYDNDQETGLLPLQSDKNLGYYSFFGGNYPERRKFFFSDKSVIKDWLKKFPEHLCLEYIDDSEKDFVPDCYIYDSSFSLDLKKFPDLESYFSSFSAKHRKNLKYDLKKLEELDYQIVCNDINDFGQLTELSKKRFGEDSNLFQPGFEEGLRRLVDIAKDKNMLQMLSIRINNKTEATEIAVFYNKVYYVLDGGANSEISNLGKLLNVEHIKRALELKAEKVDFLSSDSGWKRLWNLEETPQWEWCNFE